VASEMGWETVRDADEQEGSRSDPLVRAVAAVWTDVHRVGRPSCPRDRHRQLNPSAFGLVQTTSRYRGLLALWQSSGARAVKWWGQGSTMGGQVEATHGGLGEADGEYAVVSWDPRDAFGMAFKSGSWSGNSRPGMNRSRPHEEETTITCLPGGAVDQDCTGSDMMKSGLIDVRWRKRRERTVHRSSWRLPFSVL
jgi:hypothetical protein